jgi:DNA-binding CsgD family transcriptional regulator
MRTEFVGRERELAMLLEGLAAARAGRPRVVLCRGEPGIGKTRLAEELAARAKGFTVSWGSAIEAAGAPPYWPWRQALRTIARDVDLVAVAEGLGLTADLAPLAPDLFAGPADDLTDGGSPDDRFRFFDAVDLLLRRVARDRPLLIVLDDAQWADAGSLLLLWHVARSMNGERLLVMVNHRDTGPVPAVLVADLPREPATLQLDVRGLPAPAVARQLSALVGRELADVDVDRVQARTGGNPFFVGEVGRIIVHEQGWSELSVPVSVREAIGARVRRLSAPSALLLQAAAIVGREFPVALVTSMTDVPLHECLAALDEAAVAGLVEPTSTPGERRFVHDLVRDAVEAGLGTADRVRLHRAAADAVEAHYAGRIEPHLSDLARHWAVAAVAGERTRAARWIGRAADQAMRRLAYEEAARLRRLALTIGADGFDDVERCRILLAVGAALRLAERLPGRLEVCLEAAALARELRLPDLLAEAAVTLEGGDSDLGYELVVRSLCEEALAVLDPGPTPLRARVAANLSDVCMYLGDLDAAELASAEALTVAQHCGDEAALVAALRARQLVCSRPDGVDERARLAEEMLALGRESRVPATRMWAHLWRIDVEFQRGDLAAVARELERLAWCAEEVRGPVARWHLLQCRAVLAQAQARFADARRLTDQALAALPPSATGHISAVINRTALLSTMRVHTGERVDLTGFHAGDSGADPGSAFPAEGVIFAIAAAFQFACDGRLAEARDAYRSLGPPADWRPYPHTTTVCWAFGIGAAVALDLAEDVEMLRGLLGRFRGTHLASGAGSVAYNGPAEIYLGVAAAYLGLHDEAVADLETAAKSCAANGAAGFRVESSCLLAEALARRARPGDWARALALAADAGKQAAVLGMAPWAERARHLVAQLDEDRGGPLTPREREVAALVAQGLTNREIAGRLYLSERTAQNHVQHILTKLGLPNRSQIAVWATRRSAGRG